MDVNSKIKLIAETMTGYSVIVDTSNGANVQLSKVTMPCILVFIQESGEYLAANSHYRDSVNIRVAFLNKMPKGFKESDVTSMRYDLKQDMILLFHKLKFDFQFKINNDVVKYEIVYDEMDDNLIGVVFNDSIKERVGINLACETPDSIVVAPTSISFCQKVSECSSIISINQLLDGLQEQIDNLQTGGVQTVTGANVDNTDPLNPVIIQTNLQDVTNDGGGTTTNPITILNGNGDGVIDMGETYFNILDSTNAALLFEVNRIDDIVKVKGSDVEIQSNKVTNFNVLDNDTYPTTQATKDLVDYYAQSNIRVVGDWNATLGSYPLADESNTTPFVSQWGATIKQGFAFRVGYGQAGTVDGFDYENGDVVYALIDSPTDNAADWGDLDHNLQQANESLRGTAKIVTAAIIADETSTDDERIVTSKKLWLNFWTRILAIAHTFAAKITFTSAPRFSSVTASHVLTVDANKDLTSEAKGTAFNKDFGVLSGTVLEGNSLDNKFSYSVLKCGFSATNFLDSSTYYFGAATGNTALTSSNSARRFTSGFTGTIDKIIFRNTSSVATSAEDVDVYVKNITSGTARVHVGVSRWGNGTSGAYKLTSLNISVSEDDELEFQLVTPAFTTNGSACACYCDVYLKKPL